MDHTLLKLDATKEQIDALCMEARDNHFKSICVRVNWVERAVKNLKLSGVVVACVVGFPKAPILSRTKSGERPGVLGIGLGLTRCDSEGKLKRPWKQERRSWIWLSIILCSF